MLKKFISFFLILMLVFTQMPYTFASDSEYTVCGNSVIVLPAKSDVVSKLNYTLCKTDNPSLTVDAVFSISGDTTGLFMSEDGTLLATSAAQKGTITISALSNGQTYTKEVRVEKGLYEDFESGVVGNTPANIEKYTGTDALYITSDAVDGKNDKYLYIPFGSKATLASYTPDITDGSVNIEFDALRISESTSSSRQDRGILELRNVTRTEISDSSERNDQLYFSFKTRTYSDNINDVVMQMDANGNGSSSAFRTLFAKEVITEWFKVKINLDYTKGTYSIYVSNGDESISDIIDYKFVTSDGTYYWSNHSLSKIITAVPVDNINIYSGTLLPASLAADNQSIVIPNGNTPAKLSLTSELTVGSDAYSGVAKWELKSSYEGVSIENNMLKVTSSASAGNVVLKGSFGNFTCEKTVEICEPTISLNIENNILSVSALADTDYKIHIYKPFGGAEPIDRFMTPAEKGDGAADVITSDAHTNVSGKYSVDLSNLDEGIYNIYVEDADTNEISHIKYLHKLNELLSDSSAVANAKFSLLLSQEGVDNADAAHRAYLSLSDKALALSLINNDLQLFPASAFLSSVLEQQVNSDALKLSAKEALEDALFDASPLDILFENPDYTDVTNAVKTEGFSKIEDALSLINKYSIIKGIKNAVDSAGAKYFIEKLGSSKYNSARPMQKDYIALNIMNKDYPALESIISAIDALDITSVGYNCIINGASVVVLPAKSGQMSSLKYTLYDNETASDADAKFTISGKADGLVMLEDGTLLTSMDAKPGKIKIQAKYKSETFEKEITLKAGYFTDFQSDKEDEVAAGWEDRTSYVKKEANGNKYMDGKTDGQNARLTLEDYTSEKVTVEFNTLLTEENTTAEGWSTVFQLGSSTSGGKTGQFYFSHSARKLSGVPKIVTYGDKNGNSTDDYQVIKTLEYDNWYTSKFVFDYSVPSYSLYIGDDLVLEDYKLSVNATDYNLTKVIFGTFVDDLNIYSGECGDISYLAPSQRVASVLSGEESQTKLKLSLTFAGNTYNNIPAVWQLKDSYNGVSIEGNVLTVSPDAPLGSFVVTTTIAGVTIDKTIEIYNPSFRLSLDGNTLNIDGTSNENYNVHIYAPENGEDLIDKFMNETTADDAGATFTTQNVSATADGKASVNLSSLSAGRYNIDVEKNDQSETSHIVYFSKTSELLADSSSLESYKFEELLESLEIKEADEACNIYSELTDKTLATNLCDDDLYKFPAAVSVAALLEETSGKSDLAEFARSALSSAGIDNAAIDMLLANAIYTDVTSAVKAQGANVLEDTVNSIKTKSILIGIKNVVNKKDAMTFLAQIGSQKYNSATDAQKRVISDAVAKRTFSSIDEVKQAVNAVNITVVNTNDVNTGLTNVSTSTSSGGGGVGAPPSVSVPVVPTGTYSDVPNDFWAKDAIEILSQKGIISGYDGSFRPDDTLSRCEMAKIISVAANLNGGRADFADVSENDWFYEYVAAAMQAGLINGYDGKFNPYTSITRQDVAVILYRLFGHKLELANDMNFKDSTLVADYAREAISSLSKAGIINGYEDGSFKPQNSITRAEIAKLMSNCITLWEGESNE